MKYRYTVHYRYMGEPGVVSFYSSMILDEDQVVQSVIPEIRKKINDFRASYLVILEYDYEEI